VAVFVPGIRRLWGGLAVQIGSAGREHGPIPVAGGVGVVGGPEARCFSMVGEQTGASRLSPGRLRHSLRHLQCFGSPTGRVG